MGIRGLSRLVVVFATLLLFSVVACDSGDRERISDANDAARTGLGSSEARDSGRISAFELRTGDCYTEPDSLAIGDDESVDIEFVELRPCSGQYDFKVLNLYFVEHPEGAPYPGEFFFDNIVVTECPVNTDFYLFPISESWELGDRVVSCIQTNS